MENIITQNGNVVIVGTENEVNEQSHDLHNADISKKSVQEDLDMDPTIFDLLKSDQLSYEEKSTCDKNNQSSENNNVNSKSKILTENVNRVLNISETVSNIESPPSGSPVLKTGNSQKINVSEDLEVPPDNDPVLDNSVDISYYSTNEDLLTSVDESHYVSMIDQSNATLDTKDAEDSITTVFNNSNNEKHSNLDDTDKTLMDPNATGATVDESFTEENVVVIDGKDIESNMKTGESKLDESCDDTGINSELEKNTLKIKNKAKILLQSPISPSGKLCKEDDEELPYSKSISETSSIKLKHCEVQMGNDRISVSTEDLASNRPNLDKIKRKLNEMLETSLNDESDVVREIRRMKTELREVHSDIQMDLERIELNIITIPVKKEI